MREQTRIQRLREKIEAKYGVQTREALTEFCERTGCSLQDVAPIDLLPKPVKEPAIDENGPIPPEATRESCEEETSGLVRGVQRLRGKRFNNPSDGKYSPGERKQIATENIIKDNLRLRPRYIRPTRPKHIYAFHYRLPPSDEILVCRFWSERWKSVKQAFLKITEGRQFELHRLERTLFSPRPCREPSGISGIKMQNSATSISEKRFSGIWKEVASDVWGMAHKMAQRNGDPQCSSDLVQEAQIRLVALVASGTDDPEECKLEAFRAMDAARHRKAFLPEKGVVPLVNIPGIDDSTDPDDLT